MTDPGQGIWVSPTPAGFRRHEATALVGHGDETWRRVAHDVLRWRVKTASGFRVEADGPVAPTTAAELARGAARVCAADWGIATTGVAGPDPQDGHPVGQVFVAVAGPGIAGPGVGGPGVGGPGVGGEGVVRELSLTGDRTDIRAQTVVAVLAFLVEQLGG